MNVESQPLVSILTPVYNGAPHLAECIESVLRQTYTNWDYMIVNNGSTDESLAIALKYAAIDPRIRVLSNDRFLRIIENHNHTIRQISHESKYCKFVFADDWLSPTCIEEMVGLAEQDANIGLVGAFTMDGKGVLNTSPTIARGVRWTANRPGCIVPGTEMCRTELLGNGGYVLGTMTSLLVRSDLIRKRVMFFNEPHLHADHEACFELLSESDFGFCQQVLSFTRPRAQSTSTFASDFDVIILGKLALFLKYGHKFLNEVERQQVWSKLRHDYYRVLAHNVLRLRSALYWKYHKDTLAAFGYRLNPLFFTMAMLSDVSAHLLHPVNAFKRTCHWWARAMKRLFGGQRMNRQTAP